MSKDNFVSLVWKEHREPNGVLTDNFVRKFSQYADWDLLSENYGIDMPLDMIRAYSSNVVWISLLKNRLFSEEFLREMVPHFNYDCWQFISKYQRLSEAFIRDFPEKVDWPLIVKYQPITQKFLDEHKEYNRPEEGEIVEDSIPPWSDKVKSSTSSPSTKTE